MDISNKQKGWYRDMVAELDRRPTGQNRNLHNAKVNKNDEFYTQLTDVARELVHYKQHFKDKVVFCNCDDPTWSAFWKYFHLNFAELGLKKLISTHYDREEPTYKMEYEGGDDNNIEAGVRTPLEGNGDFRNQECIDLLVESDIVVTNPPFSLFKEYLSQLVMYDKKFIIIGNKNCITYKEFFSLWKGNMVWTGCGTPSEFGTPFGVTKKVQGLCRWFTNLDIMKRHEDVILWRKYTSTEYPKYDNYDAINVDKVANIPFDYNGEMGVPITFIDNYNPSQFDIIGLLIDYKGPDFIQGSPVYTDEKHKNSTCAVLNGKRQYAKILIRRKAGVAV